MMYAQCKACEDLDTCPLGDDCPVAHDCRFDGPPCQSCGKFCESDSDCGCEKMELDETHCLAGVATGWHATLLENVENIRRAGLVPAEVVTFSAGRRRKFTGPVHLASCPMVAADTASFCHEVTTLAVMEVDLRGLEVREGWDGPGTYAVYDPIGPGRIKHWEEIEVTT